MLSRAFYTDPYNARQTVVTKDLQAIMMETTGEITAIGRLWVLNAKRLAPGVYLITAKEKY